MSKRILTYNGIDLSTFGTHVSGEGVWAKPAPEFERISVPGRSGDVLLYNGRYSNIDIKYRFGITNNFDTNYTNLIAALLASPGYHKLVDSKHPGVYRMAAIDKGIEPTMLPQLSAGELEVTFDCKPQIYLDSGDEIASTWNASTYKTNEIHNPTGYEAHPLIKITTTSQTPGNFVVEFSYFGKNHSGGRGVDFRFTALSSGTVSNPIIFDTETEDIYDNSGKSLNDHVTIGVGEPVMVPGEGYFYARVTYTASQSIVSNVEIIPRWWRL